MNENLKNGLISLIKKNKIKDIKNFFYNSMSNLKIDEEDFNQFYSLIFKYDNVELFDYFFKLQNDDSKINEYLDLAIDNVSIKIIKNIIENYKLKLNDDIFEKLICCNNCDLITYIDKKYKYDYHKNNDQLFRDCCEKNFVNSVILLCSLTKFNLKIEQHYCDRFNDEIPFHFFCRHNYFRLAKAYYNFFGFDINCKDNEAICLCVQEGHLEMTKWLYQLGGNIKSQDNWCFYIAISKNHIHILKWIYSLNIIDIHMNSEYPFRYACGCRNLQAAQWLYSLGANIHIFDDQTFYSAVLSENYEIANWLYSLGEINLSDDNYYIFRALCETGNLDALKWVYSLSDEIDIHMFNDFPFRSACYSNNIEIAKWIYSLGHVDIKSCNHSAFCFSCKCNYLEIANWLISLNPNEYSIIVENNIIIDWKIYKILYIQGYINKETVDSCPICFENDSNLMTSCDHSFCKDCIAEYCNRQSVEINEIPCPYCRQIDMKFYDIKLDQEE